MGGRDTWDDKDVVREGDMGGCPKGEKAGPFEKAIKIRNVGGERDDESTHYNVFGGEERFYSSPHSVSKKYLDLVYREGMQASIKTKNIKCRYYLNILP